MEKNTIKEIKILLEKKTKEMQRDIDTTVTAMMPEELMQFENRLYGDYDYYEDKYANEDTIKQQIESLFGCFPVEYILSEISDYIGTRVYMCALHAYFLEQEL